MDRADSASSGNGRCSAFASSHGARLQTSRSSMRLGDRLGLGATVAVGLRRSVTFSHKREGIVFATPTNDIPRQLSASRRGRRFRRPQVVFAD